MSGTERNSILRHVWAAAGTIGACLLLQLCGAVWWASAIDTRVRRLEDDMLRIAERVRDVETRDWRQPL